MANESSEDVYKVSDAVGSASYKLTKAAADDFVRYLNGVHNLSAGNRYALAEAQATSPYFSDLHVELDLVKSIKSILGDALDVIVILTGHAGDGKSVVALDVWKHALNVPWNEPATRSPNAEEVLSLGQHKLTIVKDMSELSAHTRQEKLKLAFDSPGNALIVSNTGPLLSSLTDLLEAEGHAGREVQQKVLECLNKPLIKDELTCENILGLEGKKRVYVANLSMLSNISTAKKLLSKLASHSGWSACGDCDARERCPIRRNVEVIKQCGATVSERVGDIYRRLDAYGRRMTMRQIAAHLSFSLTGGLSCGEVRQDPNTSLRGVFSETFFGHGSRLSSQAIDALSCLRQMEDMHFGIVASPKFDQNLHERKLDKVWNYPVQLNEIKAHLESRLGSSHNGNASREMRRFVYMFGTPREEHLDTAEVFFNDFLQSPMLRKLRSWSENKNFSGMEKQRFLKKVLGVLMEEYIGASIPKSKEDNLYITLKRPDEKVLQSVQIVLGKIPFDDFSIYIDEVFGLPVLKYERSEAKLDIALPLLDYIVSKDKGEVMSDLDAIYSASLEQFRSEILESSKMTSDSISLLEIDAEGGLITHKFTPIDSGQKLVYQ